jgi:hypothetical protein
MRGGPMLVAWMAMLIGTVARAGTNDSTATLDRAAQLIEARAVDQAMTLLDGLLAGDPANRRARELLAFAFESAGDFKRELRVRAALAADYPNDAQIQAAYGRVLERTGDERAALAENLRARELGGADAEVKEAIDRLRGRTAVEVGGAAAVLTDPAATAGRIQIGLAVPLATRVHLALLDAYYVVADATTPRSSKIVAVAPSIVLRSPNGAWLAAGPRLNHTILTGSAGDVAIGGALAGTAPLGSHVTVELRADGETLWDDAAIALLHGGRQTGGIGRLYVHALERRLLLQAGVQARLLSLLVAPPGELAVRAGARQALVVAGADVVVWPRQGGEVRGEILDDAFIAPSSLPTAITASYRHYQAYAENSTAFATIVALPDRVAIDEASGRVSLVSPNRALGMELRGGVGRDSAHDAWLWRAGGAVLWAPTSAIRFALRYDHATQLIPGYAGSREEGWISCHVDL